MQEEMDSLAKNGTWSMERNTGGQRVVDNRWVFKRKLDADGNTTRYKARLVARGFSQVKGVDYNETFSPVMRYHSFRTLMALAAARKLKINFFDVKTAFLHGELKERVLMRQPEGFSDDTARVCLLRESLWSEAGIPVLEPEVRGRDWKVRPEAVRE